MADEKDHEFGVEEQEEFGTEGFTFEESPSHDSKADVMNDKTEEVEVELEGEAGIPPRKLPQTRILLLVLLLLAAAAGYFFLTSDEPPAPQPVAVKTMKQPIPMPAKPAPAPAPAPAMVEKAAPAPVTAEPAEPTAQQASEPPAAEIKDETPVTEIPAVKAPGAVPPAESKTEPETAPPAGDYSVQVGAYVQQGNLKSAEKKVDRIGYPFHVEESRKLTTMTRLHYGTFASDEATGKLEELRQYAPSAFRIANGDRVDVFAGSFVNIDKARRFADILYEQGLMLKEVPVEVEVPLFKLMLGPFSDRAAADQAASAVGAVGLPAQVVEKSDQ